MKVLGVPVHTHFPDLCSHLLAVAVAVVAFGCSPSIIGGLASDGSSSSSNVSLDDVWSVVTLTPDIQAIVAGGTFTFVASGGTTPYTFEARNGSIDATSGLYTAPMAPGGDLVIVTDADGYRAIASVTIYAPLSISPDTTTLATGNEITFAAYGGIGPYSFSAETGTIDPATGEYTAPGSPVEDVVTVTDSEGNEATAVVTVEPQPWIGTTPLLFAANENSRFTLSAAGGVNPLSYFMIEGAGTVDWSTGDYTPPISRSNETVGVVDALGNSSSIELNAVPFKVNGTVLSLAVSGSSIYVGGAFTAADPLLTLNFSILDPETGDLAPSMCNFANHLGPWTSISAMAVSDDSIYLGGYIESYGDAVVENLVKIDRRNCELDTTFTQETGVGAEVGALALDGDNLYVGLSPSWWAPASYRDESVSALIKIDAETGDLDATFGAGGGPDGRVRKILVDGDSLFIGGDFWNYAGVNTQSNAKVSKTTGELDPVFATGAGGDVYTLHLAGGSLYVGGTFHHYNGDWGAEYIAKVDPVTGAIDTAFRDLGKPSSYVYDITSTPDTLYVGGYFTTFRGNTGQGIVKLDLATGAMDTDFSDAGGASPAVNDIAIVGDSLYVGGYMDDYRGTPIGNMIKIDAETGVLDEDFTKTVGFNNEVTVVEAESEGIFVAGYFTSYRGTPAFNIAKFDLITGKPDPDFETGRGFDDFTRALLVVGNDLFVGGDFSEYDGHAATALAKLDAETGQFDTGFGDAGDVKLKYWTGWGWWSPQVYALASIGNFIYVGGRFTEYDAQPASRLARVDRTSGDLDTSVIVGNEFENDVRSFATYGGDLFVGGAFTLYRGASHPYLVKLSGDDLSVDTTFETGKGTGPDGYAYAMTVANDSLYVGGGQASYDGVTSSRLSKVDPLTGAVDEIFAAPGGFGGGAVFALAVAGSSIYAGGEFETYDGSPASYVAKLNFDTGILDTEFSSDPSLESSSWDLGAYALGIAGGSLWIGGEFDTYRGDFASDLTTVHLETGEFTD